MADQSRRKRPTLADVAKLAGVSPITVSRAIRGSAPVRAETKRRIEQAIAELGYVPNAAARQLAQGRRSDLVGVLIHNLAHSFWSRVALATQAELIQHGLISLVVDADLDLAEEARHLEDLVERGVCGIIASPCAVDSPLPGLVRKHSLPLVLLNSRSDGESDAAMVDEVEGMKQLTQHLLDRGHRKIALVSRWLSVFNYCERLQGYKAALREAGLAQDGQMIREVADGSGEAATSVLLGMPEPPTAIIAASPGLAFGVLYTLGRRQIAVPDEIEVAVFGEMPTFGTPLTRVSYEPAQDLGRRAAEMLADRINGLRGPGRQYVQPVRVIERGNLSA